MNFKKPELGFMRNNTILAIIIIFVVAASYYLESPSPEAGLYLTTIAYSAILIGITVINSLFASQFQRNKNDVELKQKQLELFYYPLLQSIRKCKNLSEIVKNDIAQLYKFQYLILNKPIKQTFLELEDGTYEGTVNEFKEFKKKVETEIERINSELIELYKK